jgi:diaminohydroxyphosphoribosylaminopyrimidine deaminase / 5-amino-6-(5-phosphoribosylamino)uracil reductase
MKRLRTVDGDTRWMTQCLKLAALGEGRVSPNPLVGAVLVRNGRILSRGYHRRFGGPHAEVECLRNYGGDPRGATLYVSLEPCAHQGKTPPCTDLILASGIREVVVAMQDPNPLVRGRGIRRLRRAGVRVRTGILGAEARDLNERFVVGITRRRPYVHLKLAQSQDGFITHAAGTKRRITGREAKEVVHRWRASHDAVLVGAGTIRADDPALTVRHAAGRHPAVVVLDGRLSVPPDAQVFKSARDRRVYVVTGKGRKRTERVRRLLEAKGVGIIELPGSRGRLQLSRVLGELYRRQIGSLLVEGGADVAEQLISEGLVDRLSVFVAPVLFGEGLKGIAITGPAPVLKGFSVHAEQVGRDVLMTLGRRHR